MSDSALPNLTCYLTRASLHALEVVIGALYAGTNDSVNQNVRFHSTESGSIADLALLHPNTECV